MSRTIFTLFVGIGVLLGCCACARADNITQPRSNVNLSPFQQWRSAAECMFNVSTHCQDKYRLTLSGTLNVSQPDVESYCKEGCADHTRDVLRCIQEVKKDFWFSNNATVWTLQNLISDGCSTFSDIKTATYKNSGIKMPHSTVLSFTSSLATLASISFFSM